MVTQILQNGVSFFSKKQTSILSAAIIISSMMLFSRILGLVRARMLAGTFGAGAELDIYFAAFRLPDLLFQLLVMGALSSSFIPIFTAYLEKHKQEEAWKLACYVINAASLIFVALAVIIFLFTKELAYLIAPDFSDWQIIKMVPLIRIMIAGQLFLVISNFITGILQSFKHFLLPAISPILYNLGIILGIVLWSSSLGILGPTLGVVLGCFLHLIIQIPLLVKLGYRHFSWKIDLRHQGLREVGRLMLPRTLGLAVNQIDPTVDMILASAITGGVSVFNLALNIQSVPVGLFGFAIATAALPTLSAQFGKEDLEKFKGVFLNALNQILFLTVPASIFLIVLRLPIVRLFLGTGKFDWQDTLMTALTLGLFAISIAAQSVVHLLARAFYALHDTRIPVIASFISMIINVVTAIFLIKTSLSVGGLALAASIANVVNAGLLLVLLDQKVSRFNRKELFIPAVKIIFTSIVMGVAIYLPVKVLDQVFLDTRYTANLLILVILVSSFGGLVFLTLSYLLNIKELRILIGILKKIRDFPKSLLKTGVEEILSDKTPIS